MPPTRTTIPVKTERTHEENQERAYIAASRRSDRSLEARVESARRASEIHKRRTGRGLKVTEQDVVNEEMYEEEDDDLPTQYRRLAAHLQTADMELNRRMNDYIAGQVATRTALAQQQQQQMGSNNGQQQAFSSSLFAPSMLEQQQQQQMRQSAYSPTHRQHPYASPRPANAARNDAGGPMRHRAGHDRRASMPTVQTITPPTTLTPEDKDNKTPLSASFAEAHRKPSFPNGYFAHLSQGPNQQNYSGFNMDSAFADNSYGNMFSTALPGNTQQLIGTTLPPSENNYLMAGADWSQLYNFNNNQQFPSQAPAPAQTDNASQDLSAQNKPQMFPTQEGLNSTLAPTMKREDSTTDLTSHNGQTLQSNQSFFDQANIGSTPADTPGLDGGHWNDFLSDEAYFQQPSSQN